MKKANTFESGKAAAIEVLVGTAADFEQIAERILSTNKKRNPQEQKELELFQARAQLLRGQIMAIQELTINN